MSQPPRQSGSRPPQRASSNRPVPPPPRNSGYGNQRPRAVQPQRDPFPYIMGGVIGAMIIGLGAVIFLILTKGNGTTPAPVATDIATPAPTVASDPPPRMAIEDFKALYDDPAKRPLVIDVRASASYAEGHIAGAVSMPESDIDVLVTSNKIPKDKMVVAYCQ